MIVFLRIIIYYADIQFNFQAVILCKERNEREAALRQTMESSQVSVRTIPEIFSKRSACEAYLRTWIRDLNPLVSRCRV